jgi:hypothetical protein
MNAGAVAATPLIVFVVRLFRLIGGQFTHVDKVEPYFTPREYGVLVGLTAGLVLVVSLLLVVSGVYLAAPFAALALVAMFPYPIARRLFIPRGWAKLAWALTAMSGVVWRRDRLGGALVAGAWALNRVSTPTASDLAFFQERLPAGRRPVLPSTVLGFGLLTAARGDLEGARALIGVVEWFDPALLPEAASYLATEWLIVDGAARGDWREVDDIAARRPLLTRTASFLAMVARRLLRVPDAPTNAMLSRAAAGTPAGLRPLLARALATPEAPPAAQAPPEIADPVGRALFAHVATIDVVPTSRARLELVAGLWDVALDGGDFDARIAERGRVLGAITTAGVRKKLEGRVFADLAALARLSDVAIGDAQCRTLQEAAALLRDDVITEVESMSQALGRRARARRDLPVCDELREWASLKAAYERSLRIGGTEVRRVLFSQVNADVCALAVWMFNERGQRALGNAMFRWLLSEAMVLQHAEALALQEKNVACGY